MIKDYCTFRLDDITPDMKWENFFRIKEIFERYQLKPLLGVVPDNGDELLHFEDCKPEFWEIIKGLQDQGYMIAQHGYKHIYETENSGLLKRNPYSEFAGLTFEQQLEKIQSGQILLRNNGIETDIFMAPGHTYDKNTLRALRESGFRYITDGYGKYPYKWEGLEFYPCRSSNYRVLTGCNTICIHTNTMKNDDFINLEKFINNHRNSLVSYHELFENVPPVLRTFKIAMQERIDLWTFKGRGYVGSSKAIQKYMQATNKGNGITKKCLRLIGMPYCLLLVLKEVHSEN